MIDKSVCLLKKELPITEEVRFRTFTYYSFMEAIVSNPYRTGNTVASIDVKGYDEAIWKNEVQQLHIDCTKQDQLIFKAKQFNLAMNAYVYRPLLLTDEQTIKIDYQQFSQPWGSIGIFITENPTFDQKKYTHQLGRFCRGEIFYRHNGEHTSHGVMNDEECTFKIKRENNWVSFYYFNEKKDEMELLEKKECCETNLYLGVYVLLEDSNYYDWVFSNYFQIKANQYADHIYLEFDNAIKRDWKYFTTNYFVNYNITTISMINRLKINICEYIRENLLSNSYIEMDVDYYDIEGIDYYGKDHYKHTCLFYGYNEDEKMFSLICVGRNGHLKKSKISYNGISNQVHSLEGEIVSENEDMIIAETYSPEVMPYTCTKEIINEYSSAFLEGKSVIGTNVVMPRNDDYVYGIDVYDHLRKHLDLVVKDIRITHLLLEHKQCMIERIAYMESKEYINKEYAIQLTEIADKILKITKKLRDNVLINLYSPKNFIYTLSDDCLKNIKELELELMHKILTIDIH